MTRNLDRAALSKELIELIIEVCNKNVSVDSVTDTEPLFGGSLDLDSLDALQVSMAVHRVYGVRIAGSTATRKALESVRTLTDTIIKKSA